MSRAKAKMLALMFIVTAVSGCKTYNAIIHNGPGRDAPKSWDFDEPVRMGFVGGAQPVNLQKVCGNKTWDTAQIYHQLFVGWKIAVRCKG